MSDNTATIRRLNDLFRFTFVGGRIMLTAGIASLPESVQADTLTKVRTFQDFSAGDDPYNEHDFGAFDVDGQKVFWKIDYYDPSLEAGSEDPADPTKTTRVLTIMLADEY